MGNTFLQICRCSRAKDGEKVDSTHSSKQPQEEKTLTNSSLVLNEVHKQHEEVCKERTSSVDKIKELIGSSAYIDTPVYRDIPPPSSKPIIAVDAKRQNQCLDDIDGNCAETVASDDSDSLASPDLSEGQTKSQFNTSTKITPHVRSDFPLSPSKSIETVDSKPQNVSARLTYDCVIRELKEIFKRKSLSHDATNWDSVKSDISDYFRSDSSEEPPKLQIDTSINISADARKEMRRSFSEHVVIIESNVQNAPSKFACDCVVQELQERFKGKNLPHDNTNWNSVRSDISDDATRLLTSRSRSSERQTQLQINTATKIDPHIGSDIPCPLSKPVVIVNAHTQNVTPRFAYNCVIHELKERFKDKNLLNIDTGRNPVESYISDDVRPLLSPNDSSEEPLKVQADTSTTDIDRHAGRDVPQSLPKPILTVVSNPQNVPPTLSYDCVIRDLKKRFKRKDMSYDDTNWDNVNNDISDTVHPLLSRPNSSGEQPKFETSTTLTNIGSHVRGNMSRSISKPSVNDHPSPQKQPSRVAYDCVIQELKMRFANKNVLNDVTNWNRVESDVSDNVSPQSSPSNSSDERTKIHTGTPVNTVRNGRRDMKRSPTRSDVTFDFKPQYGIMFILIIILFIKLLYSCTAQ